ncbi:MAG: O-antigen/teichoic acid export membrane protein [Saprospiraceae bacterium]|jgi:O-antigen/teichoic acid export membrane protein
MGVIQRQGGKESIIRFGSIILGFVNTIFIYTYFLEGRELGLIRFLQATASLFVPFLALGVVSIINRYFTFYKDQEKQHNGFLFFCLIIPTVGFLLFLILSLVFWEEMSIYYYSKNLLFGKYLHFAIPIIFFELYRQVFTNYSGVHFRIVIPSLINEIGIKIFVSSLVVLYAFAWINFQGLIIGITAIYGSILMATIFYIHHLGQLFVKPSFAVFRSEKIRDIATFSVYGILGGIGSQLVNRIDAFMVGTFIGVTETAIFTTAAHIAIVIEVPQRSLEKISLPVIADAWKKNDLLGLNTLYYKSSLNQLIFGVWVFLGIWVSIDELFLLMPKTEIYQTGKTVILILGIAKIIDMGTGVNTQIISLSKYYRFNFYLVLVVAVCNVALNLIFINVMELGINGVALATLTSLVIFNFCKCLYLKIKLDMNPFKWTTLAVILLGLTTYVLVDNIPSTNHIILDMIINSIGVTILFLVPIVYFEISKDINSILKKGVELLKKYLP